MILLSLRIGYAREDGEQLLDLRHKLPPVPPTHARRRGFRGLLVAFLASSCLLVGASTAEAGLVFKRPDGSAIRFTGTPRAWCGPWDDEVTRPSLHVELRGARRSWELSAVRSDLKIGRRIDFPIDCRASPASRFAPAAHPAACGLGTASNPTNQVT